MTVNASTQDAPLVLLVDDYEDALEIYSTYLEHFGFRVMKAPNGAEALRAVQLITPAIVLLDLSMPVLDGTRTLQALRLDPRFQRIPIIALTAHALDNEQEEALRAGFDQVIAKPCLPDELVRIIRSVLQHWTPS
jgi:two-component system, cell cycle response regulator DivK